MNIRYKNTMLLTTLYLLVLGIVFVFVPDVARNFLSVELADSGLTLLYGQVILSLAYMAYVVANNAQLSKMTGGFLLLFLGQTVIFGYLLATGKESFAQVGAPLIFSVLESYILYSIRE